MLAVLNDTGMLVVLAVVVLLFGASRLPQLARGLGEARKEFTKAAHEESGHTQATPTCALPHDPSVPPRSAETPAEVVTLARADLDPISDRAR